MRTPDFWGSREHIMGRMLAPAGALYGAAAGLRGALTRAQEVGIPVICVGNLVAGGAGKTPVAMSLAGLAREFGKTAHRLSRGYGGRLAGPVRVDAASHTAADVGDEPLLLAGAAPTWVSQDRVAGARAAEAAGADAVVMDDGYQNPALAKNLSLVVVDAQYGFGNRRVMPAGPLRESVARGLRRAQAVVVLGEGDVDGLGDRIVLRACIIPDAAAIASLKDEPVYAFAGLGRPQKFFDTLAGAGCHLAERRPFPDHFAYSDTVIGELLSAADSIGARPVTTEKDFVRIPERFRDRITALPVSIEWDDPATLRKLLAETLTAA